GIEFGHAIALDPQFPLALAAAALKDLHGAYPPVWSCGRPGWGLRLPQCTKRCALAITAAENPGPTARSRSREQLTTAETGRLCSDCGSGPIATDRGAGFRRAVSRNVASDPCRCRLRKPAAVVSRARPVGRSVRRRRCRGVRANTAKRLCAPIWRTGRTHLLALPRGQSAKRCYSAWMGLPRGRRAGLATLRKRQGRRGLAA